MQINSTSKHILTEIRNMVFKKFYITTVGTSDFSKIDRPIPGTEKYAGEWETFRGWLLEQEEFVEGKNVKIFMGIEKDHSEKLQIGV